MYDKVNTNLSFVENELDVIKYWQQNKIFEKSIELREGREAFSFFEGPPTANGEPHIGHVITRVVKDIIPRYKTMKGYKVSRKAGWDTHGLPVELEVEKVLGLSSKPEIERFGVQEFICKCKESVWKYKSNWEEMSTRVGFWVDMENPYVTYDNNYIESEWWALKRIWDEDLLYLGHRVVPYCPRCGTALSSHEVAQGYKDVKETSVYVKFKIKDTQNEYFLAWTTTPWTLPSNVALVVNANENYSKVKCGDDIYIMASALLDTVLTDKYEIIETVKGAELEGMEYEQLFPFYKADKKCCYVACDNYVTLTDGTGIVHTAPAFGEDDARVGKLYDLPFIQLVDEQGKFVDSVEPWKGVFVKDADPLIIKELRISGKLYKKADYEHSYPFCWRCDTPLIYYARDAWFIKMTALRDRLVKNNNTVNWFPENVKTGRFGNFLENVIDWGLSRERYWGTPLPIWVCENEKCGHKHAIGSIQELKEMGINVPDNIELHRPYIDAVKIKCPKCAAEMQRVPEVIDCWFDSGSMPFAQWHYPFENKEIFEQSFPADFISEAIDQTRGWFYSLMAISTLLFDKSPYKNVIVLGHVQDKDGQKMSKHKGNGIDVWSVLNKQGADAVRWYFFINSAPWLPSRFYEDAVNEAQRKFIGTLWNTYAFYVLYANIDGFNPNEYSLEYDKLSVMDKWVLSRLNSLVKSVDEMLGGYKITESARALNDFVDEVSNWYVRRSRERYWGKDMTQDKINAYMTLYTVLVTVAKTAAPFIPFMTEKIYQNLVLKINPDAPESVHLCDFPDVNEDFIDKALEDRMDLCLKIVTLGRAARNGANIKNRQPLGMMYIKAENLNLTSDDLDIIKGELNIKELKAVDDVEAFTSYKFKPQLKTLGPKYGKLVPKIGVALSSADGNSLMQQLRAGAINLTIDGTDVTLTEGDLLIEASQKDGYFAEANYGITCVIDATLTEELIEEGFVRELISKIQTMRKEADFNVTDRITVKYGKNEVIKNIITSNNKLICNEVLASGIFLDEVLSCLENPNDTPVVTGSEIVREWNVNGENVVLSLKK